MTEATLLRHAHRHLVATAKIAAGAIKERDLRDMQQRAEGVSDYPDDIVKRISHFLIQPSIPPKPPLPVYFPPGDEHESAREFATRCLLKAAQLANTAITNTDLLQIQSAALLILAFGDAAELRLRIAVKEARGH